MIEFIKRLFGSKKDSPLENSLLEKGFSVDQIVYYVKGWPNNGFGRVKSYNERTKLFTVETEYFKTLILCDRVVGLEEMIKSKTENMKAMADNEMMSQRAKEIYYENMAQIEEAKYYLKNERSSINADL